MLSSYATVGHLAAPRPTRIDDFDFEPMIFAGDDDFTANVSICGQSIYVAEFRKFARSFWPGEPLVFDTRLHMLMPTWCPSIPGWHYDEAPRASAFVCPRCGYTESTSVSSGDRCRQCEAGPFRMLNQPVLGLPREDQPEHLLCLVDFNTWSLTEFAVGEIDHTKWDAREPDMPVWGWADRNVKRMVEQWAVEVHSIRSMFIVRFGSGDYHRAVPATGSGWRLFMRATRRSKRPVFNKIRNQTQVYLPDPNRGW